MRRLLQATLLCGAAAFASHAGAQVAAESATIMSGTGVSTGNASRSLGNAVRSSVGRAAGAVAATRGGSGGVTVQRRSQGRAGGTMTRATNDPLEGTDASAYRLQNGATIRVSGRLVQSRQTDCVENCEDGAPSPED